MPTFTFTKSAAEKSALAESSHRVRVAVHLSINGRKPEEVGSVVVTSAEASSREVAGLLRDVADHLEEHGPFYQLTDGLF